MRQPLIWQRLILGALGTTLGVPGCLGTAPSPPAIEPSSPPATAPTELPHASFTVVPAELGDAGILGRIRHRLLLRRITTASLRHDGEPLDDRHQDEEDTNAILPVIGETAGRLRVVIEVDHARYAVWVERKDVSMTVLTATRLVDAGGGERPGATGVWLVPGIALDDQAGPGAAVRRITVRDEQISIEGFALTAHLGNVWVVAEHDPTPTNVKIDGYWSWSPPADARPKVRIESGAELRAAADPAAPVLARLKDDVVAARIATPPGWAEVELRRPHLRVRGFVVDTAVEPEDDKFSTGSTGSGRGYGMSHASHHQVPAGTCLYDRRDGEVIGVQLEDQDRLGARLVDRWAQVYVDSPWALARLFVVLAGDEDPSQPPTWEACTVAAPR